MRMKMPLNPDPLPRRGEEKYLWLFIPSPLMGEGKDEGDFKLFTVYSSQYFQNRPPCCTAVPYDNEMCPLTLTLSRQSTT